MVLKLSLSLRDLPWRTLVLIGFILGIFSPLLLWSYIQASARPFLYTPETQDQIPPHRVAIVFGAAIWADGTPTPMLADRIDAAIDLYRSGQVKKILMSGDNSSEYHNEVVTMENYALRQGVPAQDITLDYAGFSTYESCYRAKVIFGVEEAVLVTQNFHIARAVYTCQHLGIKAMGLGTPDWDRYRSSSVYHYTMREMLAAVKAIIQVHILRPKPTFLGKFEGIR